MDLGQGILPVSSTGEDDMVMAYFDCFSGIAGDMTLGALIDVGVDSTYVQQKLETLDISGYDFSVKKISLYGIKSKNCSN